MLKLFQNENLKIFRVACLDKDTENLATKSARMLTSLYQEVLWSRPMKKHNFCRLPAYETLTKFFFWICLFKWATDVPWFVKKFIFLSFILILATIIFANFCVHEFAERKFFYGQFLCLKVFKLNLKLCHAMYNSFLLLGTNQKWSKQGIHRYIDCYVLKRNGGCYLRKTLAKTLWKGELWREMKDDCS